MGQAVDLTFVKKNGNIGIILKQWEEWKLLHDFDRSYYIGSSDVRYVMGRWSGKSFENWYLEKMGSYRGHFSNRFTRAGNTWEHPILYALGIPGLQMDSQFVLEPIRLRVNLDGNTPSCIYEVKTYRLRRGYNREKWHEWQLQVQMYASGIHRGELVVYGLDEADYVRMARVDPGRLRRVPVAYDIQWLERCYLPRHRALVQCLIEGRFPSVQ